jgi:hypothetical protein
LLHVIRSSVVSCAIVGLDAKGANTERRLYRLPNFL